MRTRLSENFELVEFLPNGPPEQDLPPDVRENLERLVVNVLQPARSMTGLTIIVSSGYRTLEVNARVGGAKLSDHLTGNAADVYAVSSKSGSWKKNTKHLHQVLHDHYLPKIGQLILEDRRAEGVSRFWIHVSNPTPKHKGESLYCPGPGVYVAFDPAVHAKDLA